MLHICITRPNCSSICIWYFTYHAWEKFFMGFANAPPAGGVNHTTSDMHASARLILMLQSDVMNGKFNRGYTWWAAKVTSWTLGLEELPFTSSAISRISPLGQDNKNWLPSMKVKKFRKYQYKIGWMGCKWSGLNAPDTENPLSHSGLEFREFPFPIIGPLG